MLTYADEAALLKEASEELSQKQEEAGDARQRAALGNAVKALEAAGEALAAGDEAQAEKMKKRALRWAVQAVRECSNPGDAPGQIGEALREEGAMSANALARFNDLLDDLVRAKKKKAESGSPFDVGMAVNQIMLALDRLITDGWDGWHPDKAIAWYLNAAGMCENVQEQINDLLDYLNKHADDTGIPDLSHAGCAKAKEMLDDLYKKKAAGAPFEEIMDLVEKIKAFLKDQSTLTGQARKAKLNREAGEEESRESEKSGEARTPPAVTTMTFTALQGKTVVNQDFLGPVETVKFTAVDGREIAPKEADADFDDHGDHITVRVGKLARLGGIVITGVAGTVQLLAGGGGAPTPAAGVAAADGMIEVRNGAVRETFSVPEEATDILGNPREHIATIDGQPVSVVAVREGQIGISGRNIQPSGSGLSRLEVTSPSGSLVAGTSASWGYDITMPEITKTGLWVPVMAQVYGLDPQVRVIFRFIPQPGQQLDPETATMTAAELMVPAPVTRIRAERPGTQSLNVSVEAVPEP
ncbi:MAG: hypothetical protein JW793_08000 [Acidobacteria bacterium]|nr:hypothetical protein [Acidobacteriota bacterium]